VRPFPCSYHKSKTPTLTTGILSSALAPLEGSDHEPGTLTNTFGIPMGSNETFLGTTSSLVNTRLNSERLASPRHEISTKRSQETILTEPESDWRTHTIYGDPTGSQIERWVHRANPSPWSRLVVANLLHSDGGRRINASSTSTTGTIHSILLFP
jgi:hypothetical protein